MNIEFTELSPTLYADNKNGIEIYLPDQFHTTHQIGMHGKLLEFTQMARAIKYLTDMHHTVTFLATSHVLYK